MSDTIPSERPWNEGWEPTRQAEPAGRDRREAERLMAYWEGRLAELGGEVTIAGIDLTRTHTKDWSNRFLISVDQVVERSSLMLYGPQFARLMGLPAQPRTDLPMLRQLPRRYVDLFLRGCADAQSEWEPVRFEGEVERYDDKIEQYRSIFIPVGVRPNSVTCFAFGAFNCRVIDPQ
jgi:hypothetical protein